MREHIPEGSVQKEYDCSVHLNLKSLEVEKENRDFNISRCKNRLKEHSQILKGGGEYFMTIKGIVSLPPRKSGKRGK